MKFPRISLIAGLLLISIFVLTVLWAGSSEEGVKKPNECEKGNPDWVWDMPEICYKEIREEDFYDNEEMIDCSCEELRKAIILNKEYCPRHNRFSNKGEVCWGGWTRIEEIYDMAISKGCEI